MQFKGQIRRRFLTFLKNYFNPMTLRIARGSHGPFAVVRHVGRRSGKDYETPIIVQPIDAGFVIELTYGSDVDWFKNIMAAGGCNLLWHGTDYVIHGIEPLEVETGRSVFPLPERLVLRLLGKKLFFILKTKQ